MSEERSDEFYASPINRATQRTRRAA